jgi:hypothetical protein
MPIYEYYSPDTNKIYSFYAKTLAQGKTVPMCPDNPKARMQKLLSAFAIGGGKKEEPAAPAEAPAGDPATDARMESAMAAMEQEFSSVDENDPKAMARMMRRMAELSGEKLDGPMEEAVRKLEEGADPDALEDQLGDAFGPEGGAEAGDGLPPGMPAKNEAKEARARLKVRRPPPVRDPKLYDYE